MNKTRKLVITTALFLLACLSYVFAYSRKIGLCEPDAIMCGYEYRLYARVLFVFVPAFLFAFVIFFLNSRIYRNWVVFSAIWIPLTALITWYEFRGSAGGLLFYDYYHGIASFLTLAIYAVASILIILITYLRTRGKKRT